MKKTVQYDTRKEILQSLRKGGFLGLAASLSADILWEADNAGKFTHGSNLVNHTIELLKRNRISPSLYLSKEFDSSTIIRINCHNSVGYAAAALACRYGAIVAKKRGAAILVLRNVDHVGALGVYVRRMAERRCLCLMTATSKPRIAPWGTSTPTYGTTPIAVGVPCGGAPVVIDTSLSCVTTNQILAWLTQRDSLPSESALDTSGNPTMDPEAALNGSILAIGGHKGAALAFVTHLIVHSLSVGEFGDHPAFILLVDVEKAPLFEQRAEQIRSHVRNIVEESGDARMPGANYR